MGVCLAMIGFGYYVASLLAYIVKYASDSKWYPEDLNDGNVEYYMFLLAGLMLVDAAVFLFVAVRYRYVQPPDEGSPVNDDDSECDSSERTERPNCLFVCATAERPLKNSSNIFCDMRNYGP